MVVAFTAVRLIGNIRLLLASLQRLGERLQPVLDELAAGGQEAAERAARLQQRGPNRPGEG